MEAFRLLVRRGKAGALAGEVSAALDVRQNTMSGNLSILAQAGLIRNQREGRAVRYFANVEGIRDLLSFLMEDCCGGQTSLCAPLLEEVMRPMEIAD